MPIYEYVCDFCHHKFQLLQKFGEESPKKCPNCGKEGGIRKLISQTMFELKGTGWYVTDYKNTSSKEDKTESKSAKESKISEKSETKEAKSA